MYYCWKSHHLPPHEFYRLSYSEKTVLTAFFLKEMEEIKEQNEAMSGDTIQSEGTKVSEHISDEQLTNLYGERPDNI